MSMLQWKSNEYYILWVCVCSLRYTARKAHALYCHLSGCTIYSRIILKAVRFSPKKSYLTQNVSIFCTTIVRNICPSRNKSEIWTKICIGLHVKYPLFLSGFNWNLNFLDIFSKDFHISNFMKICPVWAELYHAVRRTADMTKLIVAFRNFCEILKNDSSNICTQPHDIMACILKTSPTCNSSLLEAPGRHCAVCGKLRKAACLIHHSG
jgi:hypothetical protein